MVVSDLPCLTLHSHARADGDRGEWGFTVTTDDGSTRLGIADFEPNVAGERLELLSVIRGLEALEQPSTVTIVTPSRYVTQGIAYGLDEWRQNGWTWQCYGRRAPVKNGDLWRRLDRLMDVHQVQCRYLRIDRGHVAAVAVDVQASRPFSRLAGRVWSILRGLLATESADEPAAPRSEAAWRRAASLTGPHWRKLATGSGVG